MHNISMLNVFLNFSKLILIMQVICEVHFYCALRVLPEEVNSFLINHLLSFLSLAQWYCCFFVYFLKNDIYLLLYPITIEIHAYCEKLAHSPLKLTVKVP